MTKKEWKKYAKDLESFALARIKKAMEHKPIPEDHRAWLGHKAGCHCERCDDYRRQADAAEARSEVAPKWIARLILDLRRHYVTSCTRIPTHIFLPPEYLETLLLEMPPVLGTVMNPDLVFGLTIVSKDNDDLTVMRMRPFAMWEEARRG